MKLLLVDGSNLLFQMFFGMPSRIINADGKPVQGTLGFVGALLKIIRMVDPSHVAVLFDGECANERTTLDAEYKANRIDYSAVEEQFNPFSQIDDVYRALDWLNIKHAETTCCETDDWMAAYVLTYGSERSANGEKLIVIASFDSDFFQLINDNVSVLRYRGKNTVICDQTYVYSKFGITPNQYADFKAMVGDHADNVKGVPKIGVKTAANLLRQFGSLGNMLARVEQISKPSIRQSVEQHKDRLVTNYRVIKLTNSAPLPFDLDELLYSLQDDITTNKVLQAIGLF